MLKYRSRVKVGKFKNDLPSSIVNFFTAGLVITGVGSSILYDDIKELQEKVKVLESK